LIITAIALATPGALITKGVEVEAPEADTGVVEPVAVGREGMGAETAAGTNSRARTPTAPLKLGPLALRPKIY
jgi:hypothetical protein